MYTVEQILVPVDFSSSSRCALNFAAALKGPEKPRLQLAHIVDDWAPYTRRVLFPYAALGEDDVEFEAELVDEARAALGEYFSVDARLQKRFVDDPIVRMAASHAALAELVQKVDADLVVMGAFGEGGVHRGALGATAERLMRAVVQPIMLVRDFDPKPRVRHMVVAVDLTPRSVDIFGRALGFALQAGATMETIFVVPSPLAGDTSGILKSYLKFDTDSLLKRARDRVEALFDRMLRGVDIPFAFQEQARALTKKRTILFGDPSEEIVNYADKASADLVVLGTRNAQSTSARTLGTVAWTVARSAPMHVLLIPPGDNPSLLNENES